MTCIDFPFKTYLDDEAIAQLLDLESLRPGYREIRDKIGRPIACLNLATVWILDVHPEFGPLGMVGVAVAHLEDDDRHLEPRNWVKGFLASADDFAVAEIELDPLRDLLRLPPLLEPFSGGYGRGGVAFRLRTENGSTSSRIVFDNPVGKEWIAIEGACVTVAKQVALASDREKLIHFSVAWDEYFSRRRISLERETLKRAKGK